MRSVMTKVSIRLPVMLARRLKAKARAAKTTPSAVLRDAAEKYVGLSRKSRLKTLQKHIKPHAGSWDGDISGEELLRLTRP
jgi:hypothetical protein